MARLRIDLEESVSKGLERIKQRLDEIAKLAQNVTTETQKEDFVEFAESV